MLLIIVQLPLLCCNQLIWLCFSEIYGRVVKLVYTLDSKSCELTLVRVQVPPRPPTKGRTLSYGFLVGRYKALDDLNKLTGSLRSLQMSNC